MNTPEFDTELDRLLRQALKPVAAREAPQSLWRRIARAILSSPPRWGRLLSWFYGFDLIHQLILHQPYYSESSGGCLPSPYHGFFATQVLDLRMAS